MGIGAVVGSEFGGRVMRRGSYESVLKTAALLEEAGLDESLWPRALDGVRQLLGASAYTLLVTHRVQGGCLNFIHSKLPDDVVAAIRKGAVGLDPRVARAIEEDVGSILSDVPGAVEDSDQLSFPKWFQKKTGLKHYLGAKVFEHDDVVCLAGFLWEASHEPPSVAELSLFSRVIPHIMRAFEMSHRLSALQVGNHAADLGAVEGLRGVALLRDNGSVAYADDALNEICSRNDGIALARGLLLVQGRERQKKLNQAIASVTGQAPSDNAHKELFILPRRGGKSPLTLLVAPVTRRIMFGFQAIAAAIFVIDQERRSLCRTELLEDVFSMTAREAELAARLAQGQNLTLAARRMAIRPATARSYLKRVFAKTETHRQADLAGLVNSIAGLDSRINLS